MNFNELMLSMFDENLSKRNYSMKTKDLLAIYKKDPTPAANKLLVRSLFDESQIEPAKEYLVEQIDAYRDSEDDFRLLVTIFSVNEDFVQAQIFINSIKDAAFKKEMTTICRDLEMIYLRDDDEHVQKLEQSFYHIGAKSIVEQQRLVKDAMKLPVDKYVNGAKGALSDPFLYPAVRFELLDTLRELEVEGELSIKWIDGESYQVDLQKLTPLPESKSSIGVFLALENRFGQSSPAILQNLSKTFNLFLGYLYPFNDDVITNYDTWVEVAYQIQKGNQIDVNRCDNATKSAYEWQVKLMKLIDSLK